MGSVCYWSGLHGAAKMLAVAEYIATQSHITVLVVPDQEQAQRWSQSLAIFLQGSDLPIFVFPDWETLPYDQFSPHQDIVSERLSSLYQLGSRPGPGVFILTPETLMQRLVPKQFLLGRVFGLKTGEHRNLNQLPLDFEQAGYRCVSQVMEHGEFAVRGSLFDVYPMGSPTPYRIDFLDNEVESIRLFDPESQRSIKQIDEIELLPAREFPLDEAGIKQFRHNWRVEFAGDPMQSPLYRDVTEGLAPAGIEYYLPLFFQETSSIFEYLPADASFILTDDLVSNCEAYWHQLRQRFEQLNIDKTRPLLKPQQLYLPVESTFGALNTHGRVQFLDEKEPPKQYQQQFHTLPPNEFQMSSKSQTPMRMVGEYLGTFPGRVLVCAESNGRRESLLELLQAEKITATRCESWQQFLNTSDPLSICVAPLDEGLVLDSPTLAVITEPQIFGGRVMQRRRRDKDKTDSDAVIKSLAELRIQAPVVHIEHGVGRYLGLQTIEVANQLTEFLCLEYAGGDKLYVPVAALHSIHRYTGLSPETAPLHKLGNSDWSRAKRKAAERVRDVAAELLAIYAKRAAKKGFVYPTAESQYEAFTNAFPFEETPDQAQAIEQVLTDMHASYPMDRLICGDVGFGKTEVAMRAAFVATVLGHRQVAILVPTTLLVQQHYDNFQDRFSQWPIRIAQISRFRSAKEQQRILADLALGKIDIIIGTHKLIQRDVKYKNLGLVIIDEEHRFGVRQKEYLKKLRAEVDILTLTATPIPRTLNMAVSGIRDLSIIATPPSKRLAIKTFVHVWNQQICEEAIQREIRRGGQVYFLHNEVESIERRAEEIQQWVPEGRVCIGHGQMRERELEKIMSDFYHKKYNILVCTTIIETGIDVPSANTIIIERADKLGLAQLYQLRGRVGRSHHQAYAYLMTPPEKVMTTDAKKRLDALSGLEHLGAGFTLATHDLEIRGAGELLGDEQSGQIQEIGFSLYTKMLEKSVAAIRAGKELDLEQSLNHSTEIDLRIASLIPEDYLPDVHERLVLYKRISAANNETELDELQVEMIDRFGLLPQPIKNLFRIMLIKLHAQSLGIRKIDAGPKGGYMLLESSPNIDVQRLIDLVQKQPRQFKLEGQEKLKFTRPLTDTDTRLNFISELLLKLTPANHQVANSRVSSANG